MRESSDAYSVASVHGAVNGMVTTSILDGDAKLLDYKRDVMDAINRSHNLQRQNCD